MRCSPILLENFVKLLDEFEAHAEGARKGDDVECVHRLRVVSRRIRSALPILEDCFPKKRFKRSMKEIKKIARLLGFARDTDVQIEFVQNYIDSIEKPNPGVEFLLTNIRERRSSMQVRIVSMLDEFSQSGL